MEKEIINFVRRYALLCREKLLIFNRSMSNLERSIKRGAVVNMKQLAEPILVSDMQKAGHT